MIYREKLINEMKNIACGLDMDFAMRQVRALTDIEYPQTFTSRKSSADYVEALLRKEGFDDTVRVDFKADGKTTHQDRRMPISWDVSDATLTVISKVEGLENSVIADYKRNPLSIVWGSVSTPEQGISARIITESEVYMGEDARGALILLNANTRCDSETISPLLDLGALGFIVDVNVGAPEAPDSVSWINSAVDDCMHWHVQSEDRDFIGFSITARDGRALRTAICKGQVWARVKSDAHRHENGKVGMISMTVKGECERELWVMAHLYEPLATDNSSGVIAAISIARLMREMIADGRMPMPKYTIRFLFTMEHYGFAAASDYFGGYLGNRAIGGINIDAMPISRYDTDIRLYVSPHSTPFFGNYVIRETFRIFEDAFGGILKVSNYGHASFGDDCLLNDSAVGLPTVWALHDCQPRYRFHHNSIRNIDFIDVNRYKALTAAIAFFIIKSTAPTDEDLGYFSEQALLIARENMEKAVSLIGDESEAASKIRYFHASEIKRLCDFEKLMPEKEVKALCERLECPENFEDKGAPLTPWQKYAKGMVAKRLTVGIPFDLIRFPKNKRKIMPGLLIYGPLANIISNIDGRTDLYEIIRKALWETDTPNVDANYKLYVNSICYLAEGGYLEVENAAVITRENIEATLTSLGIKKGDTVMLHSALSGCGYVEGGAKTLIDAFLSVIGEEGTLMAPSFTRPYMYFEGAYQRQKNFRPFRPDNIDGISTGTIPKVMLREYGAKRSAHATHSWCAIGKNAEYVVSAHKLLDTPCGDNNPMEKALGLFGKIVFFGCGVSSNTFIHYLEDRANSNFLENAIIKIVRDDGKLVTEVMRNHLPGCRDFYGKKTPTCKFYTRARERGLDIKRGALAAGEVYAMDMNEVYSIGTELFREDPDVTLCDNPSCTFCKRYRHKL